MNLLKKLTNSAWQSDQVARRVSVGDSAVGPETRCVVADGEMAVLSRGGQMLATIAPGRHKLEQVGLDFGRNKIINCDISYIRSDTLNFAWRVRQPLIVVAEGHASGAVALIGGGPVTVQVSDPWRFMLAMDARRELVLLSEVQQRLDTLLEVLVQQRGGGLISAESVNSKALHKAIEPDLANVGLSLDTFDVTLTIHPESDSLVAPMGYGQTPGVAIRPKVQSPPQRSKPAAKPAPQRAPRPTTPGYGIGPRPRPQPSAEVEPTSQQTGSEWQAAVGVSGNRAAPVVDVLTPAQAAEILMVSEDDVLVEIAAGRLKARKIGRSYRISKVNLETYLNG